MPKYPNMQSIVMQMPGRPFSKFTAEIQAMGNARYPLHIGDTYLQPLYGARIEDVNIQAHPDAHKYTFPTGYPRLIQAISEKYTVQPEQIQITPGATGGLHLLAISLLCAGDEVLILAPYWPLAAGIVRAAGAIPISVPFYDQETSVTARLSKYMTEKTVAIYVNSPNNPTGLIMSPEEVKELGELAKKHNLWIFADEVYEQLWFPSIEEKPLPIRMVAPENTISIFSFSKAYAMAGYRCGFLLYPEAKLGNILNKIVVHSFYSVSTPAQIAACFVLHEGEEWLEDTRQKYQRIGEQCADLLALPRPLAGTFLFFDISSYLRGRTMDAFLLSCIEHKLLLAPGASFGEGYENYIRLCFTCVEPDIVLEGMEILKHLLET